MSRSANDSLASNDFPSAQDFDPNTAFLSLAWDLHGGVLPCDLTFEEWDDVNLWQREKGVMEDGM